MGETAGGAASLASSELPPGTRVGEHVIEATLAAGGFGVVHRARHVPTGEARAIKVLHAEIAGSAEAVARLRREGEVLRALAHPNVLAVHDVGWLEDGRPYLVAELLEGVDLEALLRRRGRLPLEEVLAILEPLVSALGAAHDQGVVHRDLKASNVFLDERGGERRVVLLDFGVAKLLDPSAASLTSSRRMVGTAACMAPEQIRGRATDGRADLYALGVLAFHLLAGEPPFRGDSFVQAQQLHLFARPPLLSARAPVDPALDRVIARAMSKEPGQRPPTAAAFLAELRAAGSPAGGAREVALLAVHAEVFAEPGALDDPTPELLADHDAVLPIAAAALVEAGLEVAADSGNSLLAVAELAPDRASSSRARARALGAAIEAARRIDARPGRDPRVWAAITVHAGPARRRGAALEGPAVDTAGWLPDAPSPGVAATADALEGLEAETAPIVGSPGLLCVRELAPPDRLSRP